MIEALYGVILGGGVVGIWWVYSSYYERTTDRVQQEKEYMEIQKMVDEIVTKLERIIYR